MNKLGVKKGIALILGISLIALTGCKKHESKTLKELGDVGKYITIDYAEGASFDVRREDYGEVNMYMPKPYFNEQTEVPVVYNTYEGFALFHNQKYLYFYDRKAELPVSLNDITNSDEVFSCLEKVWNDLDLATFRINNVDNLSITSDDNDVKYCFDFEFSYQPRYTRENIHKKDLSGFGIITEDENGKNSIFIFGCLENMATEDEVEHIKESFTFNKNEFHVPKDDLQMKSVSLEFEENTLEGDFLKCLYIDSDNRELNAYSGNNNYYHVKSMLQGRVWSDNGIDGFISCCYGDYTDKKEFTDKDGNKWKRVQKESEEMLSLAYVTFVKGNIYYIEVNLPVLEVYSCIVDGMDNSISTISIYN